MNIQLMLNYLTDLSENNQREWHQAHKAEYQAAKSAFEELIAALIDGIGEFDHCVTQFKPKELTFKLERDTRFSHDKSPYNPSFRAHIGPQGKLPVPVGYYLMIRPGNHAFLGGGLFADMFKDATAMVRDYIAANGDEWEQLVHEPVFREHFQVQGVKLKNVPAGYDQAHPQAEYLKHKSWYLEYPITDEELCAPEAFLHKAVEVFRVMKPFNDYLNRALVDFQMPKR